MTDYVPGQLEIGIVHSVKAYGINHLAEISENLLISSAPLDEALSAKWNTDALLIQYQRRNKEGVVDSDSWVRCNKPSVSSVREAGGDIVTTMICLEWDTDPHAPWKSEEEKTAFDDKLSSALENIKTLVPSIVDWYACYYTYQGFRMIWVLSEAIPVEEAEGKIRWLMRAFDDQCLTIDEKAVDWTRLFRLPHALRPDFGQDQNGKDLTTVLHRDEYGPRLNTERQGLSKGLIPTQIPTVTVEEHQRTYAPPLRMGIPDPDKARSLVYEETQKGISDKRYTSWGKKTKELLKGKPCYDTLFARTTLAVSGKRDTTLMNYLGSVIGTVVKAQDTSYVSTPEHVFGLFYRSVEHMDQVSIDSGGKQEWVTKCWEKICRIWPRETKQYEDRLEAAARHKEEKFLDKETREDVLLAGMKQWCNHPELWDSDRDVQMGFVKRHLVAAMGTNNNYYPLQPDGFYSYGAVSKDLLVGQLKYLKMDFVIDLTVETERGSRSITPAELLTNHSTVVWGVKGESGFAGGRIFGMGTNEAVFIQPMYRINPNLKPTFNKQVNDWLLSFKDERLLDWLALCVAFKKRLVMLSIAGPGSIGKSLLTQGVVECLENPVRATEKDLGKYAQNLLKTPFIVIDEGLLENANFGGKEVSAAIREFLGGGELPIDRKYMALASAVSNGRVMVMANNTNLTAKLCGAGRDQSKEDLEAIEMRTLHIDVNDMAPRDFLSSICVDSDEGRWVHGKDHDRDFVLAKHILWLHHNRKVKEPKNKRFSMDGFIPPSIKVAMEKFTPNVDLCVEAIISMVEKPQPKEVANYMVIDEARQSIFVVASSVFKAYEALGRKGLERDMSINRIGSALAWLRKEGTDNKIPRVLTKANGTKTTPQRWSEVTFERLIKGASDYGFEATKLRQMFKGKVEGAE